MYFHNVGPSRASTITGFLYPTRKLLAQLIFTHMVRGFVCDLSFINDVAPWHMIV